MLSIQKIYWLIPLVPIVGSILTAILLISFTRTINRLTKPISFFLITSVGIPTLISGLLLFSNISEKSIEWDIELASLSFHLTFYLNLLVEKILSIGGFILFLIMITSFYFLDRKTGYVRYMTSMSTLAAIFFFLVLNGFIPDLLS